MSRPLHALLLLSGGPAVFAGDEATLIKASLDRMQRGKAAPSEWAKGSAIDEVLAKLPVSKTPWRTKYYAAEWLLRAASLRAPGDAPAATEAMERGWDFISSAIAEARDLRMNVPANTYRGADAARRVASARAVNEGIEVQKVPAEQAAAMAAVAAELAVRLKDPIRMARAAEAFEGRASIADRDLAFAFMAACHAGRWDLAGRWGQDLASRGTLMPALHRSAQEQPEVFDYSIIPDWIRAASAPPPGALAPPARLQVQLYRIRLARVEGPGAQGILEAFPKGWQESRDPGNPLVRLGALGHWLRPGTRPMPLTGSASATSLDLMGRLDLPGGARKTERLRALAGPAGNPWTGSLEVESRDAAGALTKLHFDLELELGPLP
jgi:hypothetical protein